MRAFVHDYLPNRCARNTTIWFISCAYLINFQRKELTIIMPQIDISVCETAIVSTTPIDIYKYDPCELIVKSRREYIKYHECGKRHYENDYLSLLKFDRLCLLPPICDVVRATLNVYVRDQINFSSKQSEISLFNNLDNFEGPIIDWTDKPRIEDEPDSRLIFSSNLKHRYVSCDITELVVDWHKGLQANCGITLIDTGHSRNLIVLDSKIGTHPPYITIDYLQRLPGCCPSPPPGEYLKNEFIDKAYDLSGSQADIYSSSIMVPTSKLISCFVKNTGTTAFDINLQISPDNMNFVDDPQTISVVPAQTVIITPQYFAKFIRLHINNTSPLDVIDAKIWWQLQTNNYSVL